MKIAPFSIKEPSHIILKLVQFYNNSNAIPAMHCSFKRKPNDIHVLSAFHHWASPSEIQKRVSGIFRQISLSQIDEIIERHHRLGHLEHNRSTYTFCLNARGYEYLSTSAPRMKVGNVLYHFLVRIVNECLPATSPKAS